MVIHIETINPGQVFRKLHAGTGGIKLRIQRKRQHKADDGTGQRKPAHRIGVLIAAQGQQQHAENNRRPNSQAQHFHGNSLCGYRVKVKVFFMV